LTQGHPEPILGIVMRLTGNLARPAIDTAHAAATGLPIANLLLVLVLISNILGAQT
jgi:hypothetical protein